MKPGLKLLTAAAALAIGAGGSAGAQEVTLAGYTNACFNCATPPNGSALQQTSLFGLAFTNSLFSGMTAGGFRGIGGNATAQGTQASNNFGSLFLASTAQAYAGNQLSLRITFTAPTGIAGSATSIFSSVIVGTVAADNQGGVSIDFNNTPILFVFSNATGAGSFLLSVNDLAMDPNQSVPITGQITGAQFALDTTIPEPGSMALVATGLVALMLGTRRHRRKTRSG